MWSFRNDEWNFECSEYFRPKSTVNPKTIDVILETYLNSVEKTVLDIDIPNNQFKNLSNEERDALII